MPTGCVRLAREAGRVVVTLPVPSATEPSPAAVAAALAADPAISHVGLVYSETGTGVIHDRAAIGAVVGAGRAAADLDAVSAFGALPLDLGAQPEMDAVVFTPNKCLEATAGLAFVAWPAIDRLVPGAGAEAGRSTSPTSTPHALRSGWGSFRFTPPAQVLAALDVALDLFDAEGGQPARLARYTANMRTLYDGVRALGLHALPAARRCRGRS